MKVYNGLCRELCLRNVMEQVVDAVPVRENAPATALQDYAALGLALLIDFTDLLPLADVVPWCTMAVLDKRFNVKIPFVTRLFNYKAVHFL